MSENSLKISGERAEIFLQQVITSNISPLKPGDVLSTLLLDKDACLLDIVTLRREGENVFLMVCSNPGKTKLASSWLEELSNGYIIFDEDIFAKINGPVMIKDEEVKIKKVPLMDLDGKDIETIYKNHPELFSLSKPYFIGQKRLRKIVSSDKNYKIHPHLSPPPWRGRNEERGKKTPLYPEHLKRKARISPFAGWEMPIFYTSIIEEHQAVRRTAALFDIGHMGMIEIKGKGATSFLDAVTTNYVWRLKDGESFYSFILDPKGSVLDDVMIYRRNRKDYLLVCNCINQEKIWNWLNSVNSNQYLIDKDYPEKEIEEKVILRNLSAQSAGKEQKSILALQGPNSLLILKRIVAENDIRRLEKLQKREFIETSIAKRKVIIAYTGYTGEKIGFEIFLFATDSLLIWNLILKEGRGFGVKPAGLGARDSTRTEAGFPLWGKELAGKFNISPVEAGAGFYVKFHKPWFVGRETLLRKKLRKKIVSFEMTERAIPREDYPIIFKNKRIGEVTSGTFSPFTPLRNTKDRRPSVKFLTGFTEKYIGLAYVDIEYSNIGQEFEIEIRGKNYKGKII